MRRRLTFSCLTAVILLGVAATVVMSPPSVKNNDLSNSYRTDQSKLRGQSPGQLIDSATIIDFKLHPSASQRLAPELTQTNDSSTDVELRTLFVRAGIGLELLSPEHDYAAALNSILFQRDALSNNESLSNNEFLSNKKSEIDTAIAIIIAQWLTKDPAAVWWWLEENDITGTLDRFRNAIVQSWLDKDPNQALFAISNLPTSEIKVQLLAAYAQHLVADEPEHAFYWASDLQVQEERMHALDRVVYHWANSDPEQVITHLNAITDEVFREQLILQAGPSITAHLTLLNPYNAINWVETLSAREQEFLRPIAFQQWVNINPQEAFNWLNTERTPTQAEIYMTSVSETLAYQDLPTALQIFPEQSEKVKIDMASSISFRLFQQDPHEAQAWSNNLFNPSVQQSADKGILLANIDDAPETALQMAIDYTGPDQDEVLVTTATEVDQQHPELLQEWLLSAPLSHDQHANILQSLIRQPIE